MDHTEKIVDKQVGRNSDLFAQAIAKIPTQEERYPYLRILVSVIEQAHPEWNQAPTKDRQVANLVFRMSKGRIDTTEVSEIVRLRDAERGYGPPPPEKPKEEASASDNAAAAESAGTSDQAAAAESAGTSDEASAAPAETPEAQATEEVKEQAPEQPEEAQAAPSEESGEQASLEFGNESDGDTDKD